ncbi:hypothetical protein Ancab_022162, partial [Ancistrocladus abbreviatus]
EHKTSDGGSGVVVKDFAENCAGGSHGGGSGQAVMAMEGLVEVFLASETLIIVSEERNSKARRTAKCTSSSSY